MTDAVNAFTERLPHGPRWLRGRVKDTIWMKGLRATRGSRAFADFICPEDAVAVRRLRAAGAAIVGRTTNPELCFRGVTQSVLHGVTRNPFDLTRVCGRLQRRVGGRGRLRRRADGARYRRRWFHTYSGVVLRRGRPQADVRIGPGDTRLPRLGDAVGRRADRAHRGRCPFLLDVIAGPDPSDPGSLNVPRLPLPGDRRGRRPAGATPAPPPATPAMPRRPPRRRPGRPPAAAPGDLRVAASPDLGHLPVEPAVRAAFSAAIAELRAAGWDIAEQDDGLKR